MSARAADEPERDRPATIGEPRPPARPEVAPPRLQRASALTGLDVVTLAGDRAVEVKDVVFDKQAGRLTGFTLRKPGLLGGPQKQVLPIDAVHAVGNDAVMIDSHRSFVAPDALASSGDNVIGDRVITDDGVDLGEVTDVLVSIRGGTADVVAFEVAPSSNVEDSEGGAVFVPLPVAMAISGEAVVVPAQVRRHLTSELDELPVMVDAVRADMDGA